MPGKHLPALKAAHYHEGIKSIFCTECSEPDVFLAVNCNTKFVLFFFKFHDLSELPIGGTLQWNGLVIEAIEHA